MPHLRTCDVTALYLNRDGRYRTGNTYRFICLKIKTYRNAGSDASWADVAVLVKEIFLRILILHTNAQKFNIVTMSLNIFSK